MRKVISLEEKLEIMKRYINETGEEINFETKYKGYNLSAMKNNLRQKDFKGELDISSELRKEFERIGVLGERKRRIKTSDYEKYEIIVEYLEGKKVDVTDEILKQYQRWLQRQYNSGTIQLLPEEIEELRKRGILRETPKKQSENASIYGISIKDAKYIIKYFGSVEQFIHSYKNGEIDISGLKGIFLRPRIVAISSLEITAQQLSKCVNLFGKMISNDPIKQGQYINIDTLLLEFGQLNDKEKNIILNELKNKENKKTKRQLAKEIGLPANYPGEILKRIIGRWTVHRGVIGNINRCEDEKIKEAYERAYEYFMEYENVLNPNEIIPASFQIEVPTEEQKQKMNILTDRRCANSVTFSNKEDEGR